MRKVLIGVLLVTVLMICFVIPGFASGNSLYKTTPIDEKWATYASKDEMVAACKIDSNILSNMTTDDLVKAVLDYPLLVNIYLYDSYEEGLEALAKDSDAYRELLKRPDAGEKLLSRLQTSSFNSNENSLEKKTIKLLTVEKTVWNNIADKQSAERLLAPNVININVQTPNNTSVPVVIQGEVLTSDQKTAIDNQTKSAYPNATFLASSTTNYNCHSYAWYWASTSNLYWMDNPSAYMSDGSYNRVTSTSAAGDRMYFDYGAHSAVVYAAGGPIGNLNLLTVTSKWGQGPLMRHVANYSPYSSSAVTLWRIK